MSDKKPLPPARSEQNFDLFSEVSVPLNVDLGETTLTVGDIVDLEPDSIIELPKSAGDNMEIKIKDVKLALGELFVIEGSIGVRITEILSDEHPV